uniref:DUF4806 domain-containing protein n=1 Tax=Photinus pyralis TaxID=7054 RepID=A0A1Y1MQY3_PHOPY
MPKYKLSRSSYRHAQVKSNQQIVQLEHTGLLNISNTTNGFIDETSIDKNVLQLDDFDYSFLSSYVEKENTDANFVTSCDKNPKTPIWNDLSNGNELNFRTIHNKSLPLDLDPSKLADWAIENSITHAAINSLLSLLKPFHSNLPTDARTLLSTPRKLKLDIIEPGHYYHFGLNIAVTKLIQKYGKNLECIKICINIDGLPLSKSSSNQLYPILCNLYENPQVVETVGLYQGFDKPKNANLLLERFIGEAVSLTLNGFHCNGYIIPFKIVAFICDAPAKAFILFTKGHTGYNSCSKCHIEGTFINNRVCFPEVDNLRLRTDTDFREKVDDGHHVGTSLVETIPNFDMVNDIVLDPMHLIHLGVMRKLLILWIEGKPGSKLPSLKVKMISDHLLSLKHNIPIEFNRKPRSLSDIKRFKATEFRQILFYTGPLILKSVLSFDMYLNFLSLHAATTILSNSTLICELGDYADSLFKYFITTFGVLYGKDQISHNIHNLIHISKDAKQFGILEQFSAYPFENYLQRFKTLIRKGDKPLPQIIKRIMEQHSSQHTSTQLFEKFPVPKNPHFDGPLLNFEYLEQYKQINFNNFILKLSEADSCCCLHDKTVVLIKNFVKTAENLFIIGQKFEQIEDYYTEPCKSSILDIFLVSRIGALCSWNVNQIAFKCVKFPFGNKFVVFPLLHSATTK